MLKIQVSWFGINTNVHKCRPPVISSLQTKQTPLPAHEQLPARRRGRRINAFVQRIRRDDFERGSVLDHRDRTATVGQVDMTSGGNGGGVGGADSRDAFGAEEDFAGGRVEAGEDAAFALEEIEPSPGEEGRGDVGCVLTGLPDDVFAAFDVALAVEPEGPEEGAAEAARDEGQPVGRDGRGDRALGLAAAAPEFLTRRGGRACLPD